MSMQKYFATNQGTPQNVISHIKKISSQVKPDDLFVLFLAGHGWVDQRDGLHLPQSFAFVSPNFNTTNKQTIANSGIPFSSEYGKKNSLYYLLSNMPCRKLLLLDCCHSGSLNPNVNRNAFRSLFPNNLGPTVLAACGENQSSYAYPFTSHGVFTESILDSLDANNKKTDQNNNQKIELNELSTQVKDTVDELITALIGALSPEQKGAWRSTGS